MGRVRIEGELEMIKVNFRRFDYGLDLEKLYEYMMIDQNQRLFSYKFQVHNIVMFERWISEKFAKNEYHDFFMVEDAANNTIGFTFSYDFFVFDGHCKYTLCLYDDYQNKGYGAVAAIKMLDYLFCNYPLKRVFISVFDYNKNSLLMNMKGGFEEVGCLPEYRFWGGDNVSLHILNITRAKFYERYSKIIMRINK